MPARGHWTTRGWLAAVLALSGGSPGGAQTAGPPAERPEAAGPPPVVHAIEIRSDVPVARRRDSKSYLAFSVGEPLAPEAVRRTLRSLQASGLASRIEISSHPAGEGVVVVVALWSNLLVEAVELEGDLGIFQRRELQAALPLRPGDALVESRVLRGDFRLEETLEREGYLDARVNLRVEVDEEGKRATVRYLVTPGERVTIGSVRFEGDRGPFSAEELTEQLRAGPGEPYQQRVVRGDSARLRGWLLGQGYRAAAVTLLAAERAPEGGGVDLTYRVEVGPRVLTVVEGAPLQRLRRQGLLPFLGEEGFDEALVLQAVDRIKTRFQGQGHYRVEVTSRQERGRGEQGEVLRVLITVDPGPVYSLKEVRFEGNRQASDRELMEHMETSASGVLGLSGGRLVDEALASDLTNLRSFYALQGFARARVGPPRLDFRDREIVLTLPIEEGARRRVGGLRFEGLEALDEDGVRRGFLLAEGGAFHPSLLEDSLDALRSRYLALGHGEARVSSIVRWDPEQTVAEVTVQVFEGPRQVLDRIVVLGNRVTESRIVARALGIHPGDPISEPGLLEMERNLYRLGIFSRVDIELVPGDIGSTRRDVVVRVEEGKTRSMTYGVGYDSEDGPRGLVGFSLRNVFGRAYVFRSDLRLSSKDRRFRLLFDQPWIPGWPVGLAYELFRLEEDRESYEASRLIGRFEARRGFGEEGGRRSEPSRRRFSLAYDYRRIQLDNMAGALVASRPEGGPPLVKPGILSPLEEEDGRPVRVWVSSLTPGFVVDHRDDAIEPTHGWLSGVQLQLAFPFARAEASHLKLFYRHGHYFDLGRFGVFATSLRLGGIEPLETPPGTEGDPLLAVPLDERFFAGGRTTHRAFPRFGLGIPGETLVVAGEDREPIGGNALALVNLEVRFPITGALGGVVFFDSGNVWRGRGDVHLSDLRNGAGLGLRYLSPIGPLRLEAGWKLDRQPGESGFELHFSFGNPF